MVEEEIIKEIASPIQAPLQIATADRLEGIGEYYFSKKLREIDDLNKAGKKVINLGIGSPDMPPHPDVIKVLHEESSKPNTHAYQNYKGSPVLRNAIAGWYKTWYGVTLDPDTDILPLIGSKEGIMHICMTYLNKGDKVLVPNPGYPTYRSAVTLAGGICESYALKAANNWEPDLEALPTEGVKLLFVNYPHMPTGQKPSAGFFKKLVDWAIANSILVVHDNPYSFILNDEPMSLLSVEGAKNVVIELNSLSKSHNMAGWRVGTICAAKERVDEILRFKSNMDSGMFLPVQLAAATALQLPGEWYEKVNQVYKERREKVYMLLDQLHCQYSRQQSGMFVWAKVGAAYKDGYQLSDEVLYQSAVFITPGGIFGDAGDAYIRISLCSPVEKIEESIQRISVLKLFS
jgi:LL-diaminopimelate aminotransferase